MQKSLFPYDEPRMGDVERAANAAGHRWIIGVDEAGRGPLAGPVYAAAVLLDLHDLDHEWIQSLNDSKKLKADARDELYDAIQAQAIGWSIAAREHDVIDEINILEATRESMKQAIEDVASQYDQPIDGVYIDGKQYLDIELPQTCVVKGDARSFHIAAASILAKVARDRVMEAHHETWPEYNFAQHKGYGTKAHREAIAKHGPCDIHRKTFGGVREYLEKQDTT